MGAYLASTAVASTPLSASTSIGRGEATNRPLLADLSRGVHDGMGLGLAPLRQSFVFGMLSIRGGKSAHPASVSWICAVPEPCYRWQV